MKLAPEDSDAIYMRGDIHYEMSRFALAAADYSAVLKLDPEDPWALYSRGLSYAHLDDSAAARSDFDKALEVSGSEERSELASEICDQLLAQRHIALSLRYCRRAFSE